MNGESATRGVQAGSSNPLPPIMVGVDHTQAHCGIRCTEVSVLITTRALARAPLYLCEALNAEGATVAGRLLALGKIAKWLEDNPEGAEP